MTARPLSRPGFVGLLALLVSLAGCGAAAVHQGAQQVQTAGVAAPAPAAGKGGPQVADPQRKILYSASLDVVVQELDPAMAEVRHLMEQHKAYLAASEVRGTTGHVRTATYTIRVPAENFRTLKDALLSLGDAERDTIKSDDVTEEFYDLQGRLKNLRSSQDRLIELKTMATVKEVLEIEPQLERVHERIEQIEGRLKYINTFAALSTIELMLREYRDYKPATAASFSERISRTFRTSLTSLREFGEGLVLVIVALGPWLLLLVPLALLGLWVVRRVRRQIADAFRSRPSPPPTPAPLPPAE